MHCAPAKAQHFSAFPAATRGTRHHVTQIAKFRPKAKPVMASATQISLPENTSNAISPPFLITRLIHQRGTVASYVEEYASPK